MQVVVYCFVAKKWNERLSEMHFCEHDCGSRFASAKKIEKELYVIIAHKGQKSYPCKPYVQQI